MMKPRHLIIIGCATLASLTFSGCETTKTTGASAPAAAPAMCKVRATMTNGDIKIELPPFDEKSQEVREALIPVLKHYVRDTMSLREGESKEFEIDLNAMLQMARAGR